jgi:hypothetical protein
MEGQKRNRGERRDHGGNTKPQQVSDFDLVVDRDHRDLLMQISRRDGAIHLSRDPEPFGDWYYSDVISPRHRGAEEL